MINFPLEYTRLFWILCCVYLGTKLNYGLSFCVIYFFYHLLKTFKHFEKLFQLSCLKDRFLIYGGKKKLSVDNKLSMLDKFIERIYIPLT